MTRLKRTSDLRIEDWQKVPVKGFSREELGEIAGAKIRRYGPKETAERAKSEKTHPRRCRVINCA